MNPRQIADRIRDFAAGRAFGGAAVELMAMAALVEDLPGPRENAELKVGKAGLHAENAGLRAEVERLRAGAELHAYSRLFRDRDCPEYHKWLADAVFDRNRSASGALVTVGYDPLRLGFVVTVGGTA